MESTVRKIHDNTIRILGEIGVNLYSDSVIEKIKKHGIKVEGKTAFFTEKQIMDAVAKVPKSFDVKARNPKHDMHIGDNDVEYCPGYGCTNIIEPDGTLREALRDDYVKFLKLIEASDVFNINGGLAVQPCDINADNSHMIMMSDILEYSNKCIMSIPGPRKSVQELMDMMTIVFGEEELKKEGKSLTLISTVSPLVIDEHALDSMEVCIEYNQPMIITPGPISGGTGPITLAANLSLGNAEALAAICISQILKEGTPVIYGLLPTTSNIRNGCISIGSPGFTLQSKYSAELARFYGLPNRSGGTQSDAKGVSVQSGYEAMMNMFSTRLNGANFVIHSAGILDSFGAMSYEKFICDLEIISMVDYYFKDVPVTEDDLAFGAIKEVGHGGQFLSNSHTFERCRTVPWFHSIGSNDILPDNRMYVEGLGSNMEKEIGKLIDSYRKPEMDSIVKKQLDEYLSVRNVIR
ncbi:trimethylamine---corrinoid protein Co-methyltransferase [Dethiosulfatibacter aminovorans DSM 17477]|uniref:Trimethylamine---corrinoid protein Co-methyltransferase n=1 Tax=Dethiosulfatibacter aminovorans DSM 17477 TaxID=1121476 RepID=A0A1M6N5I0_9FIRM|nr:trimethylamine methyltransferase family protein [Dethiosulfatibacter aminovorans]SHJ90968.1 trimethylamine---corrinoid protein Co-methyltransferase [Dethiosulfatibacter aminovorans DSM 17477]